MVPIGVMVACPVCGSAGHSFERELASYRLVRCSSCRFVYVNPQPSPETLHAAYTDRDPSAVTAFYETVISESDLQAYDQFVERLERIGGRTGRLLDFGCGAAYLTECAQRRGWDAYGVDLGEWVLEAAARRRVRNVFAGYLHEQPFEHGSFDAVVSLEVFEHLPKPIEQLAELSRMLRAGGLLLVGVPNYGSLSKRLGRDHFRLNLPPQHLNYFTAQTITGLMSRSGFDVLEVFSWGGLNLENILGREQRTPTTAVIDGATPSASRVGAKHGRSPLKAAVMPLVKASLYRRLHLGMSLIAIAKKGEADDCPAA